MANTFVIKKKISSLYNKIVSVSGDKSLSIRWVLLASLANGKSRSFNLLNSDDVKASINAIRRLGIKVKFEKNFCEKLRWRENKKNMYKSFLIITKLEKN